MPNVVRMESADPDPEMIKELEKQLVRAKMGEIVAMAFVAVDPKGFVTTGFNLDYARNASCFTLLGAIVRLLHRVQRYVDEEE